MYAAYGIVMLLYVMIGSTILSLGLWNVVQYSIVLYCTTLIIAP